MDIVITYVNGMDPVWRNEYESAVGKQLLSKRYRDWGTLPFLFRAIEKNVPFVRNVFLVVSSESQVPQWVDREKVRIVLHRDIIPASLLPVFNSTAIEMFLHRIPGLDEEFVYFNDDMFPMRECREDTFFVDGKARIGMKKRLILGGNTFNHHIKNSDALARSSAGLGRDLLSLRPQHCCYCLLKSACEELYELKTGEIENSVTPLRRNWNHNIYLFLDYIHHTGRSVNRRMSKKHFSLAVSGIGKICRFIENPSCDFVCINDVEMSAEKFNESRKVILSSFERAFPAKSRFEL